MRRVIEHIEQRTAELSRLPLFEFLRDPSLDPRQRLSFAPSVAHFVMSFADLYAFVLQVHPATDKYQELVNAHAQEDENHWRWFLDDLSKLGFDPKVAFSDALRFVWSDVTVATRALTYRMCRLGYGATSLEKLTLVHVIEAAGKVTVAGVSAVGTEYAKRTGQKLVYMGAYHLATESDHTLEDVKVHQDVATIELDDEQIPRHLAIVDEGFDAFSAFVGDMLETAKAYRLVK
jgi:hypothetical protein